MKLTNRDLEIIDHLEAVGGATIEQINALFFPSYTRASQRLKQLSKNKFIKAHIQPTIGKLTYYTDKMPSYHTLVINEILIVLTGKYKGYKRPKKPIAKHLQPDLIVQLKNGKYLMFEIEIFNKVSDKRIEYICKTIEDMSMDCDLWIVSKRQSATRPCGVYKGKIGIEDIKKLCYYY